MQILKRNIRVATETFISSIWAVPQNYEESERGALILAHGAGNDMNNPFLSYVHESIAEQGMLSVKFDFPYKEQGRKAPDRAPVLRDSWRAVIQAVRHLELHATGEYKFPRGRRRAQQIDVVGKN